MGAAAQSKSKSRRTRKPAKVVEIDEQPRIATVELDVMVPWERNARRGNIAAIVESLREFGQHRPVVLQRGTNRIIAGNHLYRAAKSLGWTDLDAYWVDDDDEKALRRALADNAVGDKGSWDHEMLAELVAATGAVPGIDEAEVEKLVREAQEKAADDDAPVFPLVAKAGEEYAYVVIVALNETDSAWLETRFDLRQELDYKSTRKQLSRVLVVERARDLIDP